MNNNYYKNIEIVKQSGNELIGLDEAKEFLRINADDNNPLINNLIKQARKYAENLCNLSLVDKIYAITYNVIKEYEIILPYGPVAKIEKIEYLIGGTKIPFTNYFFNIDLQELYLGSKNIAHSGLTITYSTQFDESHIHYDEIKSVLMMHINLLYKYRLPDSDLLRKINNLYQNIRQLRIS